MDPRPATPSLLRELNDRTALELLLTRGPMTRAQIGESTGLSKVTAAQLLGRLEERGLVQVTGTQSGGRGPNAAVYAVVPSTAYVAGLHVEAEAVRLLHREHRRVREGLVRDAERIEAGEKIDLCCGRGHDRGIMEMGAHAAIGDPR